MPRYTIDTDDAQAFFPGDPELSYASVHEAHAEAHRVLGGMAEDAMPNGEQRTFTAVIRDERGAKVYTATLTLVGHWHQRPSE